jgi:predicted DNA-binding protein (MmcQ/YjbR family)
MASRGLKWLQHFGPPSGLSDDELKRHIKLSYEMVFAGLTKKRQAELAGTASSD